MNTAAPDDPSMSDAHTDPVMVAMWNAQPELPDGESYFEPTMTISVTETIITTYNVTESQLAALSLPFDADELEERDGDFITTSLSEQHDATTESVIERDLTFTIAK
ncbi:MULTISPECIES: hypothetical protein [unclassified Microbacterium]|uniref:hypothetical protein n=1 Tax=unclassified Microbacterium TaxID=2609290 RepID=UPI00288348C0|nr:MULTISPECIES: hypothetical protein [unclassified Microbacterium]